MSEFLSHKVCPIGFGFRQKQESAIPVEPVPVTVSIQQQVPTPTVLLTKLGFILDCHEVGEATALGIVVLHCLTKLRIVVTVIVHYVFSLGPQFDII
jgi:hypothetical protein